MRQALCAMVLACVILAAGEVTAITGGDYQRLTPNERAMYVAGTLEGWISADAIMKRSPSPLFTASIGGIVTCVSGRLSTAQVRTIVDRHVAKNPSERNQEMGRLLMLAMLEACR
jgi:hypothetical protein